ncbi:MAG: alanine--tRNA ligase [Alphaproteobacteria bacterium]|nr:alanine--tRNA ligase [Alphaproteobacteria bacterium]
MTSVNKIRSTFLDYFEKNGHEVVQSGSLVPDNDPTLMFTTAGMVQFKNIFTGAEKRDYNRATTSQKCVRAGGKHNDLDNVGYTARHHTFFEMLGNFSFGDYFKENAIEFAWNLITKEYGLPKEKLLATVYAEDDEAFDLWKKIAGFSDSRIIRIPTSDNFWSMGDTGPCGPCSEIFFDHGEKVQGGAPGSPEEDGDRFMEIWNLVFMQYEQVEPGNRINLPKPSIDTGMGIERLAAILQGKHDNFDVDVLRSLIETSAHESSTDPDGKHKISHRVIADHLRASCFLVADGVLPSNEGRGYVLRRIMRRAMRHAHLLGCKDSLMYRLVPALEKEMGEAYPELGRAKSLMTETLRLEEERFKRTLDRGVKLLDAETAKLSDGGELDGQVAFKLYDTYGFPVDLTEDALRRDGYTLDVAGFDSAMEKQKEEARKSWTGSGDAATEAVWFELKEKNGASEFLGYATTSAEAQVCVILVDGKPVDNAKSGQEVMILTNQTPFYGESGGQAGDIGVIKTVEGKAVINVTDTLKKVGALHAHVGKIAEGEVSVGDSAEMLVDIENRNATRNNHSVTHLLQAALRKILGDHVMQKGSQVNSEGMRFDISHQKMVSHWELRKIEEEVNRQIRLNTEVTTRVMEPDQAVEAGAMALFGEKYGDEVRVVMMGEKTDDKYFSFELCGGTHVNRTGDIGFFKILNESAVAAGVRRIEGVTGAGALAYVNENEDVLLKSAEVLKIVPRDLVSRISAVVDERKKLEKEISELRKKVALNGNSGAVSSEDANAVIQVNGVNFDGRVIQGVPVKELKGMVDELKKKIDSGVVALIGVNDRKISLVVGVTEDLVGKLSAVDLVRVGAVAVGGKSGGGRPDMAQSGGAEGGNPADAIEAIKKAM